jgi:hypothetical protein
MRALKMDDLSKSIPLKHIQDSFCKAQDRRDHLRKKPGHTGAPKIKKSMKLMPEMIHGNRSINAPLRIVPESAMVVREPSEGK